VFWLLLSLLLLVSVVALALVLLTLWRRVRALGRQVGEAGEAAARVQQAVADARVGGPLEVKPCPTCGTAVQARLLREAAG
jgi:hypothetical protein